jgi:hypothetical protein
MVFLKRRIYTTFDKLIINGLKANFLMYSFNLLNLNIKQVIIIKNISFDISHIINLLY